MTEHEFDVLIIGAGHAGVQVAATLVARSFTGTIALLSAESSAPYERPPLTKGYLKGEVSMEELILRPAAFWRESSAKLFLDQTVLSLDPVEHLVETQSGNRFRYSTLVWAAGAAPFRIPVPGSDLPGVHVLRSLDDAVGFRDAVGPGTRVAVIGGGYIGLEAASAGMGRGAQVTVIEAQPRLLSRVTGSDVADRILAEHRRQGVVVELGAGVTAIGERDGRAASVMLSDGRELPADIVLMAVGVRPNVEALAAAGAVCSNGVEVDVRARTSLQDVYAAGDCTFFPVGGDERIRLESLQNAVEQGELVAGDILGDKREYSLQPYFWSHQYDLKIKTVGLFTGHDEAIMREGARDDSFSVVYLREGRVCAVDSVNAMKDYVDARSIVGGHVDTAVVRDPSRRLREALIDEAAANGDAPPAS
ncbi:NAD(P)/FAD-dependent oxidoreductase [Microbacterium trichothecenolyticum]|uniref:Ferredoxin--NAD(P)(+) reductase fdr n=1 Tax=Microbacterium trichothecenolyticum TaxID=69370 RepID=A0A0M2H7H6_MICTR|nr:FAD-dependent oxidoreductase [Microbacterium trichothecenolyticum]KJL42345.1 Ferredoxin--NAD(P)(+) reductase fdr [Microbacterium trichothecenolyticum]